MNFFQKLSLGLDIVATLVSQIEMAKSNDSDGGNKITRLEQMNIAGLLLSKTMLAMGQNVELETEEEGEAKQ